MNADTLAQLKSAEDFEWSQIAPPDSLIVNRFPNTQMEN